MMNNPLEITKTNSDCTQYTGTVTIASYLGDRLIHKETHHNSGLKTLFEFIGGCLQGNWYEAKNKRPCKLVMLKAAEGESDFLTPEGTETKKDPPDKRGWSTPTNLNPNMFDEKGNHFWSSKYAVCSPTLYDTAATTKTTATSNSITYHFRVPFLSLVGGSKIKKLMLLPQNAVDYRANACAYYVLDEEIAVPVAGANFTIIIDWTLEFTNSHE